MRNDTVIIGKTAVTRIWSLPEWKGVSSVDGPVELAESVLTDGRVARKAKAL